MRGTVEVGLTDGRNLPADAEGASGGITLTARNGFRIDPRYVRRIEDTSHAWGALQGLGIGGAVGGSLGLMLGLTADDDGFLFNNSRGEMVLLGTAVVGTVGGVLGLVIGFVKGRTVVYQPTTTSTAVRAGGPPGSVAGVTVDF